MEKEKVKETEEKQVDVPIVQKEEVVPVEKVDDESYYEKVLDQIYEEFREKEETEKALTEDQVRSIAKDEAVKAIKAFWKGVREGKYPMPPSKYPYPKEKEEEEEKYPYPPKKKEEPDFNALFKELKDEIGSYRDNIDKRLTEISKELDIVKNQPAEIISKEQSQKEELAGFESDYTESRDGGLERKRY